MVKRWSLLVVSLLMTTFLAGCALTPKTAPKPVPTQTVKLYFSNADNDRLVTEQRQINIKSGQDKYTVVLQTLLKGPQNDKYRVNISPNTRIYGTIKQNNKLIVDVNKDFSAFGGSMAETLGVGAFVNTLTQFKEINEVKILVEGEELKGPSGNPRGFMKTFPMQPQSAQKPIPSNKTQPETQSVQRNVTLYFGSQEATAVVPETRTISVPTNIGQENYIKMIVNELIKGPRRDDLRRTIPAEARVRSVTLKNTTAYIDFSNEMHTKHWRGATGESMTLNSIVNTLTELSYVTQVLISVEGKPLNIEHVVMDKPMKRNQKMIHR